MSTVTRPPSFFPARLSQYVPAMRYSAEAVTNGPVEISFGTPATQTTTNVMAALAVAVGGATIAAASILITTIDATYGRILRLTCDNVAITGYVFTVTGRDFWGQKMVETITPAQATTVSGLKCFKYIDGIVYAAGTGAATMSLGTGNIFGVPYKIDHCLGEVFAGVLAAAGTVVGGVLTDPATAATGDPRGKYTPTSTPDGASEIRATFLVNDWVNASTNGGLMGIRHFGG